MKKEENEINLIFNKTISALAGNNYGYEEFKKQLKDRIDYKKLNVLIFPNNIEKIAISFIQGMFRDILKVVDKNDFEKYFIIRTSSDKLTNKIIENIKF